MLGSGRRKEDSASVLPEMFSALLQDSFGRETFRGWNPKVRIHHETHQKGITLRLVVLPETLSPDSKQLPEEEHFKSK